MLRISKLADYGTKVMVALAQEPGRVFAASELAETSRIPLPTVSKILKMFSKAELLRSQRGTLGGYQLALPAEQISLAKIVSVLDGAIAMTNCKDNCCELASGCNTKHNWLTISEVIKSVLDNITLAQMLKPIRNTEIPINFYPINREMRA
jgi:FeS assembly SUF system regulator